MARDETRNPGAPGRNETEAERLDRNYNELLQELRVSQTGVQILFAFLLSIAFTERFARATDFQQNTYVVAVMLAAGAAALLIAPVAFHRMVFRHRQKDALVMTANRLALGGLVLLLGAIVASVLLVLDEVLGRTHGYVLSAIVAVWCLGFWFVLPVVSRERDETAE